jgi:hypothetical protein
MNPLGKTCSFDTRQTVVASIGKENMRQFELWAFKVSPIKYNTDILTLWNLTHSTDEHVSENLNRGLHQIIRFWKAE